jgi:hypothetical protein
MALDDPPPSDNRHLTKYVADAILDAWGARAPRAIPERGGVVWLWVAARHCELVDGWVRDERFERLG